jgi:hypothetical protein
MDGLPGMKIGLATAKTEKIAPIVKMVGPKAPKTNGTGYAVHTQKQIQLIILLSFLLGVFAALYGLPLWNQVKSLVGNEGLRAAVVST